jgi:predicted dehydrogenase
MITRALGPLETVSVNATTSLAEIIVGAAPDDPGAKRVPARAPDQYAVAGALASGALFSGTWRALATGPHGGPALLFVIDGSEGQIRVQSDNPGAGFPQVFPPDEMWVNGEKISLEEENKAMGPTARAWAEFAKGEEGEYPGLEDAVLLRRQVEAIKKAAETGRKVLVSDI